MAWESTAQFIKKQEAIGARAGLPKKHVHIDTAKDMPEALRKGGMLYEAESLNEAVAATPALRCPNCNSLATGIAGGNQLYTVEKKSSSGKTYKANVPDCPVPGFPQVPIQYAVDPCGCKVSSEWSSSFSQELSSRLAGNPPNKLGLMSDKSLQARLSTLEGILSKLYTLQANPTTVEQKEAADYWVVIVADQIQRLCPGAHNQMPVAKTPLNKSVENWAIAGGFKQPPQATATTTPEIAPGTPLYRTLNGKVSSQPAYVGQEPCGFAASVPYSTPGKPPSIYSKPQPKQINPNQDAPWEPTATAKLTPSESPEVFQSAKGAWMVRWHGETKVAKSRNHAYDLSATWILQNAGKSMKVPKLQTLPVEQEVNLFGATQDEAEDFANGLKGKVSSQPGLGGPKVFILPKGSPTQVAAPTEEPKETTIPDVIPTAQVDRTVRKKRTIRKITDVDSE